MRRRIIRFNRWAVLVVICTASSLSLIIFIGPASRTEGTDFSLDGLHNNTEPIDSLGHSLPASNTPMTSFETLWSPILTGDDIFRNFSSDTPVSSVSCRKLLQGDPDELQKARRSWELEERLKNWTRRFPCDASIKNLASDCYELKRKVGFAARSTSPEEEAYPLAYSIVVHANAGQLVRLLRSIYFPQNIYCIHVDKKSTDSFKNAVNAISNCFANVLVASRSEAVVYASISRLQADLNCMRDLLQNHFYKWRYLINLVGYDFPLKTNSELVKIFKIYGGQNEVENLPMGVLQSRFKRSFHIATPGPGCKFPERAAGIVYSCNSSYLVAGEVKESPPYGINITKGSAFGAFSRAFVRFLFTDMKAKALLRWAADTYSPDELYWATLNDVYGNPQLHTPGGYSGDVDRKVRERKPFLAKLVVWNGASGSRCHGRWSRALCVFGMGDLPLLVSSKQFFANKIDQKLQPYTYDCMEEWLRNNTLIQQQMDPPLLNAYHYRNLPQVLDQAV